MCNTFHAGEPPAHPQGPNWWPPARSPRPTRTQAAPGPTEGSNEELASKLASNDGPEAAAQGRSERG